MRWLLRPSLLIFLSAALALGAAGVALWPRHGGSSGVPVPRPVPPGDQEIVWLNSATSAVAWERFVSGVSRVQRHHPELGLAVDYANAFPRQTTAVPELALGVEGKSGRLWLRWYKLTGDLKTEDWVEALAARRNGPPPLAVIGGGSSDRARDLALKLQQVHDRPGSRPAPLLLLTTATANRVPLDDDQASYAALQGVYPGRTFRFCYNNRQMAEALLDFLGGQDDLRPDAEPVYLPDWDDDPYSEDFAEQFRDLLYQEKERQELLEIARLWAWPARRLAAGAVPPGLDFRGLLAGLGPTARPGAGPCWLVHIPHSVGTYNRPNPEEEEAARMLLNEFGRHPEQRRPLLVLPATAPPARRFLNALMHISPVEARPFVVATGDSLDFNTVFRDRRLAWNVRDLPFPLVFFCHRNPVDPEEFRPEAARRTGTEDLLLYADILKEVARAAYGPEGLVGHPDRLADNFRAADPPVFDRDGNRPDGAGAHIVCLRPVREGMRVLPRSRLQVYRADPEAWPRWQPACPEMTLDYGILGPATAPEEGPER